MMILLVALIELVVVGFVRFTTVQARGNTQQKRTGSEPDHKASLQEPEIPRSPQVISEYTTTPDPTTN